MIRAAILDMYDGTPNLGLTSIADVLKSEFPSIQFSMFDVRSRGKMPDLDFDIFISTGGPGHPLEGAWRWGDAYFGWLDQVIKHNANHEQKKYVLFICHSFQLACHHFGVGKITKRPKDSFGIFPMKKTEVGMRDHLFEHLPQPFYAADFRTYQVTEPNTKRIQEMGASILAMEDPNHHDFPELAIMAIRFFPEMYGLQFHPEASPVGMTKYFGEVKRKKQILDRHGAAVYEEMMFHMRDPIKIGLTHRKLLPGFLKFVRASLSEIAVTA